MRILAQRTRGGSFGRNPGQGAASGGALTDDPRFRQTRSPLGCLPIPQALLDALPKEVCRYCREVPLQWHLDHILPLSRGGQHAIDNVQWTCQPCNDSKGAKTHEEFLIFRALRVAA